MTATASDDELTDSRRATLGIASTQELARGT